MKLDTSLLATGLNLESERKYAQTSNQASRLKIERGESRLIRILPYLQPPGHEVFARIGQHWINNRAFACKQHTSPNYGGDPDYECPVCSTASMCKSEAQDDETSDKYYSVQARVTYRCYCLVFKRESAKKVIEVVEGDEMFIPYEFNIPKTSWGALASKIDRSKTRKGASDLGLLDLKSGQDLWAIRDSKNSLTFDLSDEGPAPAFTLDDHFEAKIARVVRQINVPTVKFFDDKKMAELAEMVAELEFKAASEIISSSSSGRSRFGSRDSSDDSAGRGRGRFARSDDSDREEEPRSRSRHQEEEEEEPRSRSRRQEEEEPTARPARETRFAEAEEAPRPPRKQSSYDLARKALGDDDDQIPGAEIPAKPAKAKQDPEPEPEPEGDDEAPAVSTSRGGSTAKPSRVEVPAAVAAGRRAGSAPPPPTSTSRDTGKIDDDPSELADEESDPVPAEKTEVVEDVVEERPRPTVGRMHAAMKGSVTRMASSGR